MAVHQTHKVYHVKYIWVYTYNNTQHSIWNIEDGLFLRQYSIHSRHTEYVMCTHYISVLEISLHYNLYFASSLSVAHLAHILIRLYGFITVNWNGSDFPMLHASRAFRHETMVVLENVLQIKFHNAFIHFMFNLMLLREWKIFYLNYLLQ